MYISSARWVNTVTVWDSILSNLQDSRNILDDIVWAILPSIVMAI